MSHRIKHARTFEVSRVQRSTELLSEVPFRQALARRLCGKVLLSDERLDWDLPFSAEKDRENDIDQFIAEEEGFIQSIEACSCNHEQSISVLMHPVLAAIHLAFTQHRPICISPDMIWLLICQGVAQHVNLNSVGLRRQFVAHQGKIRLKVNRDDLIMGSADNRWDQVINEFSSHIEEHIGPAHGLFVPRFSTTGPEERFAAEIALLDAMQSYFEYEV